MDTSTQRFVIGIDAGGTSLRVWVAEATTEMPRGSVEGEADPEGRTATLSSLVQEALAKAGGNMAEVGAVCAGITKITRTGVRDHWRETLARLFPHLTDSTRQIVPDYVIAFHGALPQGIGIAVIAGTGSVVYGEDGQGGTLRVGGRGWEFGDEGSGAWLTAEMVRRTLRALDGLEHPTPVTEAVCALLGTHDPAQFGERARQHATSEGRGFLTPLAREMAEAGDREAGGFFVGAGGWLAAYVRAAHRRLNLADGPHIATIGGMWEAGELLAKPFRLVIERWLPGAVVVVPDASPVVGAVRLAQRLYLDPNRPIAG